MISRRLRRSRSIGLHLAWVVAAGAVGGCGPDAPQTASTSSTTATTATTATTTAAAAAAASSTTTTSATSVPPPPPAAPASTAAPVVQATPPTTAPSTLSCPAITGVPSGAADVTTAAVDFDGDGMADTLRVYRNGSAWHVRAEFGSTGVHDQVLPPVTGTPMTAIGGATVDNDATQEAWVKVGSGGSTDIISPFVFRQCQLQRVELNGGPAEFPIGASVTHASGLECVEPNVGLERLDTTSSDGSTYTGTSETYTLDLSSPAPALVLGTTSPVSESDPPGGPPFERLTQFRCDGLGNIP